MRSLKFKSSYNSNTGKWFLQHPESKPGESRTGTTIEITNIPDEVANHKIAILINSVCLLPTWFGAKPPRYKFEFSELESGKIIKE